MKTMHKHLFTAIRTLISVALLAILVYMMRGQYSQIVIALKSTKMPIFIYALIAFIAAVTIASLRLKLIIKTQEIPITFLESFSLTFIGYFFNNFLPTAVGGDVVKAYYLSTKTQHKVSAYTAIFIDRAIGLFTMIFMAFLVLICTGSVLRDTRLVEVTWAVTIISLMITLVLMNKKIARRFASIFVLFRPINDKLRRAYTAIHKYKAHTSFLTISLVLSFVSQLFYFLSMGIAALSLGSSIPFMDILIRVPLVCAASLLPSINGLGVREGSTVVLFGPLIGKQSAFALSILQLIILLITSVIGGIIYMLSPQFKVKLNKVPEAL